MKRRHTVHPTWSNWSQTYFKRRYLPPFLKPTSSLSSLLKALACTPSEAFAHVHQINLGSQALPETTESTWRHVWSHFYVSFQEETVSPWGSVNVRMRRLRFLKSELIIEIKKAFNNLQSWSGRKTFPILPSNFSVLYSNLVKVN